MDKQEVVNLIKRLAGQPLNDNEPYSPGAALMRGTPRDLRPLGREWYRELEHVNVHPTILGDRVLAECKWFPTLPEVLEVLNLIELPARKFEGCCEDGWVQVLAWPKVVFKPCPNCSAAAYNSWANDDAGWIDVPL